MAQGTDSVSVLELDYDTDLGETSRIAVDPWTGRLQDPGCTTPVPTFAPSSGDPDRTSRVHVDPWTGHVLVEPLRDPVTFLEVPDRRPSLATKRLELRTAALVVGASLCAGALIGSVIAAVALI